MLGQKTCEMSKFAKSPAPWITDLSRGGLVVPSDFFMQKVYSMEKIFSSFHGDSISFKENIIGQLFQVFEANLPELSSEILRKYARTRTFIRLRFLNLKLRTFEVKLNFFDPVKVVFGI